MTKNKPGSPSAAQSRGYRNRNPGNIEYNERNKWLGLADPPSDGRFCRFTEHHYGIRALAVLLMAYFDRHGCDTIAKIIMRYAPKNENPTYDYTNVVAKGAGVSPDARINLHDANVMFSLVKGIIRVELGGMPYTDQELWHGLELAGFHRPKPSTVLEASQTDTGKGTLATAAAGVAVAVAQAEPIVDTLGQLPWQVSLALLAAVVIAVLVWRSRRT